jgi:hypothetical protein
MNRPRNVTLLPKNMLRKIRNGKCAITKYIFPCHSERSEESRSLFTWQARRFLTSFGMTFFLYS